MSAIDVHPDDLLDAELRGALTGDQRARLDDHLARCAACRMERVLRADFDEELRTAGHAPSLQSFVSGALRATASMAPPEAPEAARADAPRKDEPSPPREATASTPGRRPRRTLVWLAAAAVLLAAGAAAADGPRLRAALAEVREEIVVAFGAKRPEPRSEAAPRRAHDAPDPARASAVDPPPTEPSSDARTTDELARDATPRARSPVALEPHAPVAPPVASPATLRSPVGVTARGAREPTGSAPSAAAPSLAPADFTALPPASTVEAPQRSAGTSVAAPERPSAPALFDRATDARRRGRTGEARVLYRSLQQSHPESEEARLSLAVMARMHLDSGDARAALEGFDAYLATGDRALREDALVGRALAHERLGRTSDAARAWRALLTAYPGSAYARTARERLGGGLP